ncbi:hypothetical protein ATPR_1550 [Acetobacter tropicalis NBRC 101654]|uniref:Uncharacterized protein n=1 Tax=Acetobacter tropicalis NBRC 101654 TaxID=749388 RepID=F7VDV1_9PROT|nr:hypothetical protein ATPR_1550 [Acetobacter tropicalis NBRC 101654]
MDMKWRLTSIISPRQRKRGASFRLAWVITAPVASRPASCSREARPCRIPTGPAASSVAPEAETVSAYCSGMSRAGKAPSFPAQWSVMVKAEASAEDATNLIGWPVSFSRRVRKRSTAVTRTGSAFPSHRITMVLGNGDVAPSVWMLEGAGMITGFSAPPGPAPLVTGALSAGAADQTSAVAETRKQRMGRVICRIMKNPLSFFSGQQRVQGA